MLAPDFPGHGRSAGAPLSSIAALADWTAALIAAAGAPARALVGHSMGSLVALETAARHPDKVSALALIATTAPMRVSDDLLAAAKANDHAAVDMISIWGNGYRATLGGSSAPGLWMLGGAERLLERAPPGVIFTDLAACNDYGGALAAAAKVTVPSIVIQGSRDMMTPAKGGRARRCGHSGLPRRHDRGRRSHADERASRRSAGRAAGMTSLHGRVQMLHYRRRIRKPGSAA